uniref:Uncharacterized protein n=1 Tax=Suricata suricatta TaxID=37032 RepID=A0A673VJ96_SURSU
MRITNRLRVCFLQGASSGLCRVTDGQHREGFFRTRRPLRLRDMYRPLNAAHMKNMAQKLHDKDSSDEYVTRENLVYNKEVLES